MRDDLTVMARRQLPRLLIVYTDECIYHTNNDTQGAWRIPGVLPKFPPKKSEGQGVMVIVFVTEHGEVRLNEEQLKKAREKYGVEFDGETRFKLEIGKARDGYLNGTMYEKVVEKLHQVLLYAFPGDNYALVMDQSSVHFRYGADALRASTFNLRDDSMAQLEKRKAKAELLGFEYVEVRSGTWRDEEGAEHTQEFYFNDGRQKGAETILTERRVPEPEGGWTRAAALEALSAQSDFQGEQSALQRRWRELTNNLGKIIMTPKYHPEFSPVELLWAVGKRYARQNCKYNIAGLREIIDDTFKLITPDLCKRCFSHVEAWERAYNEGAETGAVARKMVRGDRLARRKARATAEETYDLAQMFHAELNRADETRTCESESQNILRMPRRGPATSHRAVPLPPQLNEAAKEAIEAVRRGAH